MPPASKTREAREAKSGVAQQRVRESEFVLKTSSERAAALLAETGRGSVDMLRGAGGASVGMFKKATASLASDETGGEDLGHDEMSTLRLKRKKIEEEYSQGSGVRQALRMLVRS